MRHHFIRYVFTCLLVLLAVPGPVRADNCRQCGVETAVGNSGPCGNCGCSSPLWELPTPSSLYWNDPTCCVDDPCVLPSCVDSIPATWYGAADVLAITRDVAGARVFQTDGSNDLSVLDEDSLDAPFEAGARVTVGRALGSWYRLEGTYLGNFNWTDTTTVRDFDANGQAGVGDLLSPFSDFGNPNAIAGVDLNSSATVTYESELQSVEMNLTRRLDLRANKRWARNDDEWCSNSSLFMNRRVEAAFLVGIRYVQLDDRFRYQTVSSVPANVGSANDLLTVASNDMLGAQLGLISQFALHRRAWINVEAKGGVYQNSVGVSTSFRNTNSGGGLLNSFDDIDERNRTSWLGELSVAYNHQLARFLTLRIGYNALAAADVAIGSQNFIDNLDLLRSGPISAENNADVIYHGPSLGLIGTW